MRLRNLRRGYRGFTLIEVLIALTLFTLVLTALVGGMRTLGTGADAVEQRTRGMEEMRAVTQFLVRTLELHHPAWVDLQGNPKIAFVGGAERLEWSGALPARHAPHGLFWLQLSLGDGDSKGYGDLLLCYAPLPDARYPSLPRDCVSHPLTHGVGALEFTYLLPDGSWVDHWSETRQFPVAVRFRIKADGRWWPDRIVRLNRAG